MVGIQKAEQGDLSIKVPHGILDEIGIVRRNFNRMAESLKQSKDKLTQYATTLEQKVTERTAEVEAQTALAMAQRNRSDELFVTQHLTC